MGDLHFSVYKSFHVYRKANCDVPTGAKAGVGPKSTLK